MHCSQCRTEINLNEKFCSNCGVAVEAIPDVKSAHVLGDYLQLPTKANPKAWVLLCKENKRYLVASFVIFLIGIILLISQLPKELSKPTVDASSDDSMKTALLQSPEDLNIIQSISYHL